MYVQRAYTYRRQKLLYSEQSYLGRVCNKRSNTQEIKFLYQTGGKVIPIEVKSKNGATLSLNNFIKNYAPPFAYKLISGSVGVSDTKITLPLYMTMFI